MLKINLWLPGGKGGGKPGDQDWRIGTLIGKWSGPTVQHRPHHSVLCNDQRGKTAWRVAICICITDSFCCTPSLVAQLVKDPPAMQETLVRFLGQEDPLEKGLATYPWAFLVAQLVRNLSARWETWVLSLGWEDPLEKERLPTPGFWPGEFHRLYSPWGHKESDTTERLSLSLGGKKL